MHAISTMKASLAVLVPFVANGITALQQTHSYDSLECVSIVALASTHDPDYSYISNSSHSRILDESMNVFESVEADHEDQEMFDCILPSGLSIPIIGTEAQLEALRYQLNRGTFVSGESTLDGLQISGVANNPNGLWEDTSAFVGAIKSAVATLPEGEWNFKPIPHNLLTNANHGRKLASYEGTKKVLVVRISDKNGLVNPDSPSVMSDKIFGTYGDKYTMTSQFEACSYGKLKMSYDYGFNVPTAAPGVVEVQIDGDLTKESIFDLRNEFRTATEAKIGRSLPNSFDHVLFVIEACYNKCGWAGFATVNGWMSVYHKHHYKSMAVTLHEVGHNLNLAHSGGNDGKEYTDHSCLMGNPWFQDDRGQMCFNPSKTWQIAAAGGWYDENYMLTWDSGKTDPKYWRGNLVGVADYGSLPTNNAALVIKLETGSDIDLFVGFNRAYGINVDSKMANDMVTIIESGKNGIGYSKSVIVDKLGSGERHDFIDWRGSGRTLVIRVLNIVKTAAPWYAEIELNFNNAPVPTASPSTRPTSSPATPSPTNTFPSKYPSQSPTNTSTQFPSLSPTDLSGSPFTSTPTTECGDSVCLPHETIVNCPDDCTNAEFATYNDNIGARGANGTMFTVKAVRDVAITSISAFFRSTEEDLVQVYTKPGSYIDFETNETAWTRVYSKVIPQNGKDILTHLGSFTNNTRVVIAAGDMQSFYVYSPSNLAYRREDAYEEGDLVLSDSSLQFYAGIAVAYGKFDEGQRFSPREFSGILRYNGISLDTQQPSASPVVVPTSSPTEKPVAVMCFLIESQDTCLQNSACRWLEFNGACRRNRIGKAAKRNQRK